MDMKPHHQIILATACRCWQGGGVGQEREFSLWAEFWLFPW
jgi:hypothetical protein